DAVEVQAGGEHEHQRECRVQPKLGDRGDAGERRKRGGGTREGHTRRLCRPRWDGTAGPGQAGPKWPPRGMWIELAGNNDRVTSASAIEKSQIHSLTRPNMVSVGTIVWLSSELMFFAALFAMYFSIRAADPGLWREHTPRLDIWYALPFTLVLVGSSVTCQLGVFAAERGD